MKPNSNCFSLRPATREEASLFYSDDQTDRSLGTVGHVRMDFGSSGKGFYHTWWPHNGEQFNTPEFKEALQQFVDAVREDGLSYGYLAEMGSYRFCLRCTTSPGEYQCYLYCYDLRQQTLDRPVGRVSFANGEHMEFTAPQDYLRTIREELPTKDGTGFRFETLTDDPAVRKAVDDMVYDLYGEENPRPLADYIARHGQEMGGQQM